MDAVPGGTPGMRRIVGRRAAAHVVVCLALTIAGGCHLRRTCAVTVEADAVLTEQLALDVSRQALDRVGLGHQNFEARPFTNDASARERYFARNSLNRDNGYVLWHRIGSRPTDGVSVHLERRGASVTCLVSALK